jgi:hypothetical protein
MNQIFIFFPIPCEVDAVSFYATLVDKKIFCFSATRCFEPLNKPIKTFRCGYLRLRGGIENAIRPGGIA